MKKIAIPSEGENIAQHFGHCPEYNIIECEGNKILKKEVIPNPGHRPDFLPKYLNELGVNIVLAGGMGSRALTLFDNNDIEVITGASGTVDQAVELYLNNQLESRENACDH